MLEGVRAHRGWFGQRRLDAGRQIQQRLGGLRWQGSNNFKNWGVGSHTHVGKPFGRNAISKKLSIRDVLEDWRLEWSGLLHLDVLRNLLNALANLYQLRGACVRMSLQPPPFGPVVGFVVVVHIADRKSVG